LASEKLVPASKLESYRRVGGALAIVVIILLVALVAVYFTGPNNQTITTTTTTTQSQFVNPTRVFQVNESWYEFYDNTTYQLVPVISYRSIMQSQTFPNGSTVNIQGSVCTIVNQQDVVNVSESYSEPGATLYKSSQSNNQQMQFVALNYGIGPTCGNEGIPISETQFYIRNGQIQNENSGALFNPIKLVESESVTTYFVQGDSVTCFNQTSCSLVG